MKEYFIQTLFGKSYRPTQSEVHELKITKTGRLPFARLAKHQEMSLLAIDSDHGQYHKLSDMSADYKPFDSFFLRNIPAYVVVLFYQPRKPKILYMIRIANFVALKEWSKMKSMTEEEADRFCEKKITL